MKLTPKQARFFDEYLIDGNATRAAIAAGVPLKSASVQGSRWLKNEVIAAAIAERQAQRAAKLGATADQVISELAKLAFYDVRHLFDDKGNLKPITQLDDISAAAIAGIDVAEEKRDKDTGVLSYTKKVKLADKRGALELLGKWHKLWTDKTEHSGKLTLEQLICGDTEEAA
jgi:phage terminase small subunit